MRVHCTSGECSHCLHHLPTLVPKLPPCLGWAIVGSELIYYVSNLLNEFPKARIKFWKTPVHFANNSIAQTSKTNKKRGLSALGVIQPLPPSQSRGTEAWRRECAKMVKENREKHPKKTRGCSTILSDADEIDVDTVAPRRSCAHNTRVQVPHKFFPPAYFGCWAHLHF